jgi:parvulin-like peptidyl-prolyl isomerase
MRTQLICAAAAAILAISARAAEPAPETVLVQKGDTTVTAGDFIASVARLPEDQRFSYRADVQRITANVSSLFVARTLAGEARAAGIDKEPEIQRRLRLAEESLLAQVYMERFEKAIATPDFEARAREIYKSDAERFRVAEEVRLKHIVVSFQGRTEEETKRRAEEARAKLVAGENFARVAREYSNDPRFRNNEGTYTGSYKMFQAEVAAVARTIPLDQPSDLIRSSEGYHVIVVQERIPAQVISFEKAKGTLIAGEQAKYRKGIVEKKLAAITQSKDVVLYTDEIAALKTEVDRDLLSRLHKEKAQQDQEEKERLIREASKPTSDK